MSSDSFKVFVSGSVMLEPMLILENIRNM